MSVLLWITAFFIAIYALMVGANKVWPSQSGDDYIGASIQRVAGVAAFVFVVLSFLSWI